MYLSAVIDVGLICCLLHVILLPVVVTCMIGYSDCGLPSQQLSHGSTVHHALIETLQLTLWEWMQRLVKHHCLCHSYAACVLTYYDAHHHYLCLLGFLPMTGIILHTSWLNSSVAGLSKPCHSRVVQICNNAM